MGILRRPHRGRNRSLQLFLRRLLCDARLLSRFAHGQRYPAGHLTHVFNLGI
ncbi:MAG TPA: hypothetical protein VFA10_10465 [Ktedonobacteraceae bacterium]|nr:hypothetical protein [Ktedonobacteraceae bacterium]